MKQFSYLLVTALIISNLFSSCGDPKVEKAQSGLVRFVENYEHKMIPLQKEANLASYEAAISGKEANYKKAADLQIMVSKILSNKEDFQKLKKIKESGLVKDSLLVRQMDVLYNIYLPHQVDDETQVKIIMLQNKITQEFSNFRAKINDKEYSSNQIEDILSNSKDNEELRKAWEASKEIGTKVAKNIILAVKKRNDEAKALGFRNYYEMQLKIKGLDPQEIDNLFDELDILTRGPYSQLKAEMDEKLAKLYKIPVENLMPWNYQNRFFQQAPKIYNLNLDKYYQNADLLALDNQFYKGIGLNIEDAIGASDLFPKSGKNQLGYTVDIDREGDERILLNLDKNYISMSNLLYESGWAAYYKNIDRSLPYVLRQAPQFFIIDAVGTMFSSFASNPVWIQKMMNISDADAKKIKELAPKHLRLEKFIFSRWAQVMYRFEKALYENPDQDLNTLWWDLVENYQMLHRPTLRNSPDWATKTHIATHPCTYYNYMLGELVAAQIETYINQNIIKSDNGCMINCVNNLAVGKYLKDNIFKYGALLSWKDLLKRATGDELSANYYTDLYIRIK